MPHALAAPIGITIGINLNKQRAQAAWGLGSDGGDGGESNSPAKQASETICYRLIRRFGDAPKAPTGGLLQSLPAGSRQRLAGGPRFHNPTVCSPCPTRHAEVGRPPCSG